jgi:hypothetical protein
MPRYTRGSKHIATAERRRRASGYAVRGLSGFVDPFPLGFGTLPEKMVYSALSRRGIPFYYLNDVRFIFPEIDFDQTYQADFVIPSLMIIIEVQGAHWHSMAATMAADAFKMAVYQQAGYTALAWWDYDILANVNSLFAQTPALNSAGTFQAGNVSGELAPGQRTKTDSSQGIRTLNQKRAQRNLYRKVAPRLKTRKTRNYGSYTA